jgi:hypothetical protein
VKTNFGGHVQMEIKHEDSNNRSFIIALWTLCGHG